MPKLIDEHKCDTCNDETWHVRLAVPQPVRVVEDAARKGEKPKTFMAYADYAVIRLHSAVYGEDKHYSEVSVWASDKNEEVFPGSIYMVNAKRTLDEVLWAIGGEWGENVKPYDESDPASKANNDS